MKVAKTTINLKPAVLARLRSFAKRHNFTMSEVIERGIIHVIDETDKERTQKIWGKLSELQGAGKARTPELAKKSVDEVLYGSVDSRGRDDE